LPLLQLALVCSVLATAAEAGVSSATAATMTVRVLLIVLLLSAATTVGRLLM
jgi:hypothetical protein